MSTAAETSRSAHPARLLSWRFRADAGPALHLSSLQASHVDRVSRRLASGEYPLELTDCVCGERGATVVAAVDRYGLQLNTVQCTKCGTLRFDPYLSADAIAEFYTESYQDMYGRAVDHPKYFEKQRLYGQRLLGFLSSVGAPMRVVAEVGCGAGGALSEFQTAGSEVFGCDYSERLVAYGHSRQLPGLRHGDISVLAESMQAAGRRADVVLLHHVFEHLVAPENWLAQARELLSAEGVVIVAVPDMANADRYPSPAGDMRQFLHIAHKYNFSVTGLQALASRMNLVASLLNIDLSKQAPEIWVAFSRKPLPAPWLASDRLAAANPQQLAARLRAFERAHLWRAILRRLGIKAA